MSKYIYKNNAASTISGSLSQGGTSLTLATGTGARFPTPGAGESFLLTLFEKDESSNEINLEVVEVTTIAGDVFTIVRDVESMTGQSGGYAYPTVPAYTVYCELRWTAKSATNLLQVSDNLAGVSNASTARANLGLGSIATQAANNVAITGGSISGVTFETIDSTTTIKDNGDNTKQVKFEVSGVSTGTTRTLTVPNADGTIALTSDLSAYQAADSDLTAVAGLTTNGLMVRTNTGAMTTRSITQPASGITVTNGDGVAGAPTLALANDLSALEGLSGTGIPKRTDVDTWSMAAAGTDYAPATSGTSILKGNGSGGFSAASAGSDYGLGDVTGPASSTSGNLPSFNGTGGKTLQDSGVAAANVAQIGKQTIWIPAGAMTARTTGGASAGTGVETATNKIMLKSMDFADGASVLYAQFHVRMPKSWNASTVTASFIWTANSTSTNSVVWGIQGVSLGNDETIDAAFGSAQTVTDANTSTAYQVHLSGETSAVTISNASASEWVVFQIYRDPTNGSDTLAATAMLLGVNLYYTTSGVNDA